MELTSSFTAICHRSGNPSLAPEEHSVPADSLKEGEKRDSRAAAIKTNRHIFYSNSVFHSQMPFEENLFCLREHEGRLWVLVSFLGGMEGCFGGDGLLSMLFHRDCPVFAHLHLLPLFRQQAHNSDRMSSKESCCCFWPWLTCW